MSVFVDFVGLNTLVSSSFETGSFDNVLTTNRNTSIATIPESQLLVATNIHRNGPYSFATFKQIRIHENPLTRYQRKNNLLSFSKRAEQREITDANNNLLFIQEKFGDLVTFTEPSLVSTYHPLVYNVGTLQGENVRSYNRFGLSFDYSNHITHFTNEELNKLLLLDDLDDEVYEQIKELYLNGALESNASEIDYFEFLRYKQDIYPREINKYQAHIRQRTNYVNSFWRDSRQNRITTNGDGLSALPSAGSSLSGSLWFMDAEDEFLTMNPLNLGFNPNVSGAAGILQNKYCHFAESASIAIKSARMKPAPIYNRRHAVGVTSSVVGPNGIPIPETGSTGLGQLFQGTALWEAGTQAGKNPFYDTYDEFVEELRGAGKDFSIVPEFRMSQNIEKFLNSGSLNKMSDMFQLTGAIEGSNESSTDSFYTTYSTSDFLKHFAQIKEDHKDFVDPAAITLTCKAIKKFIAYDSFYPQQRTGDIAKQFYASYEDYIEVNNAAGGFAVATSIGKQPFLDPLVAPGVLFNSIKSGVACDYPIMFSSSLPVHSSGSAVAGEFEFFGISDANSFDFRVPFEALLDPATHLAGKSLIFNEPHPSGSFSTNPKAQWDGQQRDDLYLRMVSNFLAEVPEFFLERQSFSTIASLPQADPGFGVAEAGKEYVMRLKIFNTTNQAAALFSPVSGENKLDEYGVPQAIETPQDVVMYSRPSAFGPAIASGRYAAEHFFDSRNGFNPCFTPPYYYGEAWIDYKFTATESKKYSVSEIINNTSASAIRFDSDAMTSFVPGGVAFDEGTLKFDGAARNSAMDPYYQLNSWGAPEVKYPLNVSSMQLFASVNDRGLGKIIKTDALNRTRQLPDPQIISTDRESPDTRWVIQTKFECPVLNFKDVDVTVSPIGSQTPRGMWHQYGTQPRYNEGIYLQVTDIPQPWLAEKLGGALTYNTTGSLKDLCGFSEEPAKIGQVAGNKIISEAVVAVPYIEESGVKKFFEISNENFQNALRFFQAVDIVNKGGNPETLGLGDPEFFEARAGASVIDQVRKMKNYVFPPSMNFVDYEDVTPFAMYIFEFKHTLDQKDLSDIWQGLPPKIGRSFEISQDSVSHPLLANELLGGGKGTDLSGTGQDLNTEIRWMVFKVKKRANTNYFDKIVNVKGNNDLTFATTDVISDRTKQDLISYNWPYDFFSLVELVKIDAEIEFADIPEGKFEPKKRVVPEAVQEFSANLSRRRR